MARHQRPRLRCAAYTRKSSEEGLEQDFNSLDAQREACEAYIRSQAGEGWRLIQTRYDDGGLSGGTLERPALARLLSDVQARKVDTIVVYKVDRLTRSLSDFAKIVDVLDARDVSFVSVTQQFNTTTSMGRLTLNMLLSFAQFEREVTGERIRDKIAASKRKGLWMGGYAPLGYEPNGRTLAIVEPEAETVRTLFRLYLELGSVRRVRDQAKQLGLVTKLRRDAGGRMHGGRPMSRGHIYHLLRNPIYAGRIGHKGESFEGQHPAIIEPQRWDEVQRRLAEGAPGRPRGGGPSRNPLQGKIFDEKGNVLTPSHTAKAGRRYRYYVARDATDVSRPRDAPPLRLAARDVERAVASAVTCLLSDPVDVGRLARDLHASEKVITQLPRILEPLKGRPLDLVRRIGLGHERMVLEIDLSEPAGLPLVLRHEVPFSLRRRGPETKLVLEGGHIEPAKVDDALLRTIVRGRRWFEALLTGETRSLKEIGAREGVSDRYVGHLIPLAFLAPDIVSEVLAGRQPIDLTAEELTKRLALPASWREQRKQLGFPSPRHPDGPDYETD